MSMIMNDLLITIMNMNKAKNIIVKSRLRDNIQFRWNVGENDFILDVIYNGYKIPLYSQTGRVFCKNNKSALSESDFVSEAIQDLLDRCLMMECKTIPHVVNPLTVSVQNSGKKRLILDLREVNKHSWKQSVKYEDIKVALSLLKKNFLWLR